MRLKDTKKNTYLDQIFITLLCSYWRAPKVYIIKSTSVWYRVWYNLVGRQRSFSCTPCCATLDSKLSSSPYPTFSRSTGLLPPASSLQRKAASSPSTCCPGLQEPAETYLGSPTLNTYQKVWPGQASYLLTGLLVNKVSSIISCT